MYDVTLSFKPIKI